MALSKTITTKSGVTVQNAYHRVREVKIQGTNYLHFKVKSFADASQGQPFAEEEYGCPYDVEGTNPLNQAYTYVKTLPEFSGAQDC
jgi:hypothetical protein